VGENRLLLIEVLQKLSERRLKMANTNTLKKTSEFLLPSPNLHFFGGVLDGTVFFLEIQQDCNLLN
jgi:hypothetical protein